MGNFWAAVILTSAILWNTNSQEISSEPKSGGFNKPVFLVEIYAQGSRTQTLGNPFGREFVEKLGPGTLTDFGLR